MKTLSLSPYHTFLAKIGQNGRKMAETSQKKSKNQNLSDRFLEIIILHLWPNF